ncbi:MAG TPA: hypothetical protein VJ378_00135 [Candidatus Paceibacterota bacterium]|nr:hypothetical protein [Candidatus Paceibacterota bacterium]
MDIFLSLGNIISKILDFFGANVNYTFPLVLIIFAAIFLIYPAIMLLRKMKNHPEEFSHEKLYGDYKHSQISFGVNPKIRLFVYAIALIIIIYLIFMYRDEWLK